MPRFYSPQTGQLTEISEINPELSRGLVELPAGVGGDVPVRDYLTKTPEGRKRALAVLSPKKAAEQTATDVRNLTTYTGELPAAAPNVFRSPEEANAALAKVGGQPEKLAGLRAEELRAAGVLPQQTPEEALQEVQTSLIDEETKRAVDTLETQRGLLSAQARETISQIQASYLRRTERQKELNRVALAIRGTQTVIGGSARYAPDVAQSILKGEEQAGLREIEDLTLEMNQGIAKAQRAANEGDFALLRQEMEKLENAREKKNNLVFAQLKKSLEEDRKEEKEAKEARRQSTLDSLIGKLADEGKVDPFEILDQLRASGFEDVTIDEVGKALDVARKAEPKDGLAGLESEYRTYKYRQDVEKDIPQDMTFEEYKKSSQVPNVAEQARIRKTATIAKARPALESSRGEDGYVNPGVYIRLRSDFAQVIGSASEFDSVFAPMLSPQERARLGLGKAVGVKATEEDTEDILNAYLNAP